MKKESPRMDPDLEKKIVEDETEDEKNFRLSYHGEPTSEEIADAVLEGLEYYEGILEVISPLAEKERQNREKNGSEEQS